MNKSPMTITPGGNTTNKDKAKALEIVSQVENYLGTNVHKARVDIDRDVWKTLNELKYSTTTDDNKSVSARMLITEALVDLLDKYESGKGKYPFESGVKSFTWNK